jgi:hypothetical protein
VTALARSRSNCTSKLQTLPLVREGAPHQETSNHQKDKRNLVMGPRWDPSTGQTGRLTVGSKLTSTSTSVSPLISFPYSIIPLARTAELVDCLNVANSNEMIKDDNILRQTGM